MLGDLEMDSQFNSSGKSTDWDSHSLIYKSNKTHYNFENRNWDLQYRPIINMIMPESSRKFLDIKIGEPSLKICSIKEVDCYRARVVMTVISFPNKLMSGFYSMNFMATYPIISQNQYQFLL